MPSLRSAMTTLTNSPRLLRRVFRRSSSDNTGEASSCRGHGADTDTAAEAAADRTDSGQTAQNVDIISGSASPEVGLDLRPRYISLNFCFDKISMHDTPDIIIDDLFRFFETVMTVTVPPCRSPTCRGHLSLNTSRSGPLATPAPATATARDTSSRWVSS